jgi:hypothetical protein
LPAIDKATESHYAGRTDSYPTCTPTLGIQWIKRCRATAHDGEPSRRTLEGNMAKGHAATKRKRRHKSGNRKDSTAATMAKLKALQARANAAAGK